MSYDKPQTDSEYFQLNGIQMDGSEQGGGNALKIKWQDVDGDGLADGVTWATSREYVLGLDGTCSELLCQEFDMTASIEIMWAGLGSEQAALDIIGDITSMQLPLSDEARGLPPVSEVPVPAAFWLFGTALIGFIGISRRTNLG